MGRSNNPTRPDIMQLFIILALAACAAAAPSPNKNKKVSTMNLDVYPEKTPDVQTVDRKQEPLDTVQGSKVNLLRRKRGAQQLQIPTIDATVVNTEVDSAPVIYQVATASTIRSAPKDYDYVEF